MEANVGLGGLTLLVGAMVSGIMIAHDGAAAVQRIGGALVALFALWLIYRLTRNLLSRERPSNIQQRPYIDVAVEKSYEVQVARRTGASR
ncbi:hypothetical protein [Burkholderia gladioli]|uniref:hypothetical protein n=1 Tax=Burkholderia gladioli TaxID=28095 RepID=UPI001640FFBF|nr:hypothetical protein [Burkholderia gladioli]